MKISPTGKLEQALTWIDVLTVVAVLLFLAAFMLPRLVRPPDHRVHAISCVNNLKQVGLAARIWSGDNGDQFPMSVSTNQGGSMELALAGNAAFTFEVMSNELSTPKVLVCVNDPTRNVASDFHRLSRTNISYFVGVDATETNASMLLFGDRNITNSTRLHGGLLELTDSKPSGWTGEIHQNAGNIALSDGSVQQLSTAGLREAVRSTGVVTNRLAVP
ncbi:MAG TPA: type II secretion system protein [Candidatus Paceibacterota bacterium]|nr:type II secretion system protein [Candidatus Paceibacterota bacterium]